MFFADIPVMAMGILKEEQDFYESIKDLPKEMRDRIVDNRIKHNEAMRKIEKDRQEAKSKESCAGYGVLGFIFGLAIGS